jgi:branched-chain amino acid aminotransferase
MTTGTHDFADDRRNADILISVNGELLPRERAVVSVFDSGFVLGDGIWEGLRLIEGGIAFLDQHLDRLCEGAKAIDMDIGLSRQALTRRLFECLEANRMQDGVHVRLMVTRGVKRTPYQDPRMTIGPATVVIIPEYKLPRLEVLESGITLFTVHVRRTGPAEQDQKLNSHSKLNCILACIQAAKAGADEALMLDPAGFVATCNSTHFFIVRGGEVWNVYGAEEAFVTGTFAGLVPVRSVDGRVIGDPDRSARPISKRLRSLYQELARRSLTKIKAEVPA